MAVECVYRTTDPAILESLRAWHQGANAWLDQADAFAARWGREPMIERFSNGSARLVGISRKRGEDIPGWREIRSHDAVIYLVPMRRTKAGKVLAAEIEAMEYRTWSPPGMPWIVWKGATWHNPGIETIGGQVYATWGIDLDEATDGPAGRRATELPDDRWERVKLSAYYAAREAQQERMQTR